jgi:regulator of protease activity HflC (stomatin/prohibitin superfamily)
MKKVFILAAIVAAASCNRPEANYEGVLMTNYGRDGIKSFETVTGAQGPMFWGSELYQVPMWEQNGNPDAIYVLTKDGSKFTVDPSYTYNPTRGHGPNIVLQYKNFDIDDEDEFFDLVEKKVLNRRITDAYREEARKFKTADELMNNVERFEAVVNKRLVAEFAKKHFDLTTLTSGLNPPQSMTDAIESRNVAIQEANKVENQLNTAKKLQEKAKIDAETNRINAAGLDTRILTLKWIDAIRHSQNRIIVTDGKTPVFIN